MRLSQRTEPGTLWWSPLGISVQVTPPRTGSLGPPTDLESPSPSSMGVQLMRPTLALVLACILVASLACSSSGVRGPAGGGDGAIVLRQPNLITTEELRQVPLLTALEVVQRLRPRWLRERIGDPETARETLAVVVYVDGLLRGGILHLDLLRAADIGEMEFLTAREAIQRFGVQQGSNAILVTSN